jgi:hypothetical protein
VGYWGGKKQFSDRTNLQFVWFAFNTKNIYIYILKFFFSHDVIAFSRFHAHSLFYGTLSIIADKNLLLLTVK